MDLLNRIEIRIGLTVPEGEISKRKRSNQRERDVRTRRSKLAESEEEKREDEWEYAALSFTVLMRERSQVKVHRETHRACASSRSRGASLCLHAARPGQPAPRLVYHGTDRFIEYRHLRVPRSLRQFIHLRRAEAELGADRSATNV